MTAQGESGDDTAHHLRSGEDAPLPPSRYRLVRRLGAGGMGEVQLVDARGRAVAVKTLRPAFARDAGALARLRVEAEALRRVHHENVVGFEAAGAGWLAMEWVGGRTLADLVAADSPLAKGRAIALCDQVLAGLAAAHAAGVVHGDLKSDNVIVEALPDGTERVKLIDFGLARLLDQPTYPANRAAGSGRNDLYGTPEYLAPELVLGCEPSPASDVYAAGCLLHELLAGSPPFAGRLTVEVLTAQLSEPPPAIGARCPVRTVSAAVEAVAARALAKAPAARLPSASAFRQALATAAKAPRPRALVPARRRRRTRQVA